MTSKRRYLTASAVATIGVASAVIASVGFAAARTSRPSSSAVAAEVRLDMATLHAAALSAARSARDTADAPFLIVTVLGSNSVQTAKQLPAANKHWAILRNEAKPAAPLTSLTIAPGDSVRVLFTLLESDEVNAADEAVISKALTQMKRAPDVKALGSALTPLTNRGTHWLGSAAMLLTNEGGTTFWRALDCVSTCEVSSSPVQSGGTELSTQQSAGLSSIVELTGNGAVYHLKVTATRSK